MPKDKREIQKKDIMALDIYTKKRKTPENSGV